MTDFHPITTEQDVRDVAEAILSLTTIDDADKEDFIRRLYDEGFPALEEELDAVFAAEEDAIRADMETLARERDGLMKALPAIEEEANGKNKEATADLVEEIEEIEHTAQSEARSIEAGVDQAVQHQAAQKDAAEADAIRENLLRGNHSAQ